MSLLLIVLFSTTVHAGWLQDKAKAVQHNVGVATGAKEPTDEEIDAAAAAEYADIKAHAKPSTNAEWNAMVKRVAERIEAASGVKFQWEAILIDSPEVNAWCMPGGKIAVYTGIMPVMKTEAALAAVMGHEVAHATLKHGKRGYARAMKQNTINTAVGSLKGACQSAGCRSVANAGTRITAFGLAFFDRKFSRGDESSADRWGQYYMAKAGYDPEEAIRLWERMSASAGGKAPPEWMSTHPSDEHRQANLKTWLSGAQVWYKKAPQKYALGAPIQ